MTKIAIQPNVSGTGTFTLSAPNSNTDRTLTLPDVAGEVLTDQSDLGAANLTGDVAAARITTALNAGGSAPIFACRAWVNFDGTTTPPSIRASGNVSSVVRNGTGDYTVNFTTAMPDANYSLAGMTTGSALGNNSRIVSIKGSETGGATNKTTSAVALQSGSTATAALRNMAEINVTIFR